MSELTAKKFSARSLSAAIQLVKAEFGHDAILISRYNDNGMVHLIASPNRSLSKPHPMQGIKKRGVSISSKDHKIKTIRRPKKETNQKRKLHPPTTNTSPVEEPQTSLYSPIHYTDLDKFSHHYIYNPVKISYGQKNEDTQLINYFKNEIKEIKNLMSNHAQKTDSNNISSSLYANLVNILTDLRFRTSTIKKILNELPNLCNIEHAINYVIDKLISSLRFNAKIIDPNSPKIKVFLGPSGAGKTHFLAKMLIYYSKNSFNKNFSFIFVNHANLKVLEEAKMFARIFEANAYYAENYEELAFFVESQMDKTHIFIDMPAFDFNNPRNNFYLNFLHANKENLDVSLVIPANTDFQFIEKYVTAHHDIQFQGVCITKIDEYNYFNPIIDYCIQHHLAFRYLSNTQQSTDGLTLATSAFLYDYLAKIFYRSNSHQQIEPISHNETKELFANG